MSVLKQKIFDLLKKTELRLEDTFQDSDFGVSQVASEFPTDVYRSLGGEKDWRGLDPFAPDFLIENIHVSIDGVKEFNRYRLNTLNNEFYENFEGFELNSYKRFCRNFEKDCIKSAGNNKDWTSKLAEFHFGRSVGAGDFYGNGSSGWKLNAFRMFLTDHHFWLYKKKFARIAIYEPLMINGNLQRLDKLLLTSKQENETYIIKFLLRKLGLEERVNE